MRFVLAVDAGTTSVRAMLFGRGGEALATSQRPLTQIYPEPGMVEHDPSEIWRLCREAVREALSAPGVDPSECAAFAVTNQRETAVVWDRETGEPLCNAIVWQDRRTGPMCDELVAAGADPEVFRRTGLHIDPYFTGTKIRWILDNVPGAAEAAASGRAIAGTVDSWLIWNLTGGRVHATDHSNASRTMLFNIRDLDWDPYLLDLVGVPREMLPEPRPTGCVFGETDPSAVGVAVPIAASMGDQQAALLGQCCLSEGDVKVTFGTGGFLLMNIGEEPGLSGNGLLTTVARTSGGRAVYAMEGSIYIAGAAVQWLRDELGIVEESGETEAMAESVPDTAGCMVVPAFSGLGAPHWDQGARGMIMGLTRGTNRNHLARAVLESIAFQACDVLSAMAADAGKPIASIKVDGGASANNFLCRFLADVTGVRVLRPRVIESTALGAAREAGLAVGLWTEEEVEGGWELDREFLPTMPEEERSRRLAEWSAAVETVKDWSRIFGRRGPPPINGLSAPYNSPRMKVVIVGGVAGGASCAARLRRLDEHASIVMIERTGYVSYANCGLPYYVGGVIQERRKLTLQTPASFASRFDVDARVNSEVVSIDREAGTVGVRNAADGSEYDEPYDVLVLSPGARPVVPDAPGVDDPRVMVMRTVEDALAMRGFVERESPRTAVVCGGGYIGLEAAENLAGLGVSVTLVQRPDHVLPTLDRDMAADLHHHIRSKGVRLILSDELVSFETGGCLRAVLASGERVEADMAVVALGVRPDTALAEAAGLEMGVKGTIRVDAHMRTSDPRIYAVGDAVQVSNFVTGAPASIPLAGPANRQGRIAAENIAGGDAVYRGSLGSSVVRVFEMTAAVTGINESQAKAAGVAYDKVVTFSASHATYYPGARNMCVKTLFDPVTGTVLGAQIVGYEGVDKRADVMATAIHAGMTVQDLAELDLTYAPPFSSAKDPVNYAGFVASNVMAGLVRQFHWDELEAKVVDPGVTVLDVRTPKEFSEQHLDGELHIPVDELRARISEVPEGRPVYLVCHSGLRSYIAARILEQRGYECYNLAGGFRFFASVARDMALGSPGDYPCGIRSD